MRRVHRSTTHSDTLSKIVMQMVIQANSQGSAQSARVLATERVHALAVAHLTHIVAHVAGTGRPISFMSGLLHDFGRVLIPGLFGAKLVEVEDAAQTAIVDALHAPIGAFVAERWNLPDVVKDAILRHHDYQAESRHGCYSIEGNIVAAAERLALALGVPTMESTPSLDPENEIADDSVWQDLELESAQIQQIIEDGEQLIQRLQ